MAKTKERVILVDDNLDHRKGFRILLESGGYSVVECKSGKGALTAVEKKNFDTVTLDLSMPDVDGFEVSRVVRSKHIQNSK
jgi:CheY-like chemotaxis protein